MDRKLEQLQSARADLVAGPGEQVDEVRAPRADPAPDVDQGPGSGLM